MSFFFVASEESFHQQIYIHKIILSIYGTLNLCTETYYS